MQADGSTSLHVFQTTHVNWTAIWYGHIKLENVPVSTYAEIEECGNEAVTLSCPSREPLPLWALSLILVPSFAMVLGAFLYSIVLWRRWAVPGVGLVGCPVCCLCSKVCGQLFSNPEDVFSQEEIAQGRLEQFEISAFHDGNEVADEPDWSSAIDSIESQVVFFGYGLLDYYRDLCVRWTIGKGNFGVVNLAVLKRRGKQPARMVAVKELLHEETKFELLNEAKLMQDIPHHPNVVYLFGVTEQPFWYLKL